MSHDVITLFALFLREDAPPDKWDLVLSAPWMEADKAATLQYLSGKLTSMVPQSDVLALSRIIILEADNPTLKAILRVADLADSVVRIRDSNFGGIQIRDAVILEARRSRLVA